MNRCLSERLIAGCAALLVLSGAAWAIDNPKWDLTTKTGPDAEVPGWFINLGITGARAKLTPDAPKSLQIVFVFRNTPAFGKLEKGDQIVGVNGAAFLAPHKFGYGVGKFGYEGPLMDLGNALDECQGKRGGKLSLDVVRGEKKLQVELQLSTKYGSFSSTYPFDCKKTDLILQETYAYLIKEQKSDGTWSGRPHINAFAALALLGSGNAEYLPAVKKAVEFMAKSTSDKITFGGLPVWQYTLYGITMSEYYLITREPWVLPELDEINRWLAQAQSGATGAPERKHIAGGFGHGPYNHEAGKNGYGGMNITTAQALAAWGLMQRCGLKVDPKGPEDAHNFIARGTNKIGYVWYADGSGGEGYADMGRTGASALAHYVSPLGGEAWQAFAKLNAQCIGQHPDTFPDTHGCPLLGMATTALGAAVADPAAFRKLMDANRWCFSLAQCCDGTFYYQPNRDNNPQDYAANPRLAATAVTSLVLTCKYKKLQITGAKLIGDPSAK
ncbi:MAG TPA: DUF6288 domain-containing protein [Planctomycetota bacterium]|jgi:hypothetical protein